MGTGKIPEELTGNMLVGRTVGPLWFDRPPLKDTVSSFVTIIALTIWLLFSITTVVLVVVFS